MWGGVGRGKTWLMDMFYQSLPGTRKQRLHFHRFMLRVHEELTALQGQSDPLDIVAERFKAETDVLCFDEFFVSDITDAMLLGGLMKALFARGITLVATSNIPPTSFTETVCSGRVFCQPLMLSSSIATS
jgi:cell division protein ZapE